VTSIKPEESFQYLMAQLHVSQNFKQINTKLDQETVAAAAAELT